MLKYNVHTFTHYRITIFKIVDGDTKIFVTVWIDPEYFVTPRIK